MAGQFNDSVDTQVQDEYLAGHSPHKIAEDSGLDLGAVQSILIEARLFENSNVRDVTTRLKQAHEDVALIARWQELGPTILALAGRGEPKITIFARLSLLRPDIPPTQLLRVLEASGQPFRTTHGERHFSRSVLEYGVWCALGQQLGLSPDPLVAALTIPLADADELEGALRERGLQKSRIAELIAIAEAGRQAALERPLSLSAAGYTRTRLTLIAEQVTGSKRPPWPADAQTVSKRIGDGHWNNAMTALGLVLNTRGRKRGGLDFEDSDYEAALEGYVELCVETNTSMTYRGYDEWRKSEARAGTTRPAAVSVKQKYGYWRDAQRSVQSLSASGQVMIRNRHNTAAQNQSRESTLLSDGLRAIKSSDKAARRSMAKEMIMRTSRDFVKARSGWLKEMIDVQGPSAAQRRLKEPRGLFPKKEWDNLIQGDTEKALSERYLDGLLKTQGLGCTDGWLPPAAQASMNQLDSHDADYRVLLKIRNQLEHTSERAVVDLQQAINAHPTLSGLDKTVTETKVLQWLTANNCARLQQVCAVVPEAWTVMAGVESVVRQ